jgi:hypothetical protein
MQNGLRARFRKLSEHEDFQDLYEGQHVFAGSPTPIPPFPSHFANSPPDNLAYLLTNLPFLDQHPWLRLDPANPPTTAHPPDNAAHPPNTAAHPPITASPKPMEAGFLTQLFQRIAYYELSGLYTRKKKDYNAVSVELYFVRGRLGGTAWLRVETYVMAVGVGKVKGDAVEDLMMRVGGLADEWRVETAKVEKEREDAAEKRMKDAADKESEDPAEKETEDEAEKETEDEADEEQREDAAEKQKTNATGAVDGDVAEKEGEDMVEKEKGDAAEKGDAEEKEKKDAAEKEQEKKDPAGTVDTAKEGQQ